MPLIVMLPGIAAYVLHQKGLLQAEMAIGSKHGEVMSDNAYSAILGYLPNGLIGLSLAALTAAIVASLAGKANSISTIFTLDVYKKYIKKDADEKGMVWIGRITIIVALVIASTLSTWNDTLGIEASRAVLPTFKNIPALLVRVCLPCLYWVCFGAVQRVRRQLWVLLQASAFRLYLTFLPLLGSAMKHSCTLPTKRMTMASWFGKSHSMFAWALRLLLPC